MTDAKSTNDVGTGTDFDESFEIMLRQQLINRQLDDACIQTVYQDPTAEKEELAKFATTLPDVFAGGACIPLAAKSNANLHKRVKNDGVAATYQYGRPAMRSLVNRVAQSCITEFHHPYIGGGSRSVILDNEELDRMDKTNKKRTLKKTTTKKAKKKKKLLLENGGVDGTTGDMYVEDLSWAPEVSLPHKQQQQHQPHKFRPSSSTTSSTAMVPLGGGVMNDETTTMMMMSSEEDGFQQHQRKLLRSSSRVMREFASSKNEVSWSGKKAGTKSSSGSQNQKDMNGVPKLSTNKLYHASKSKIQRLTLDEMFYIEKQLREELKR